MGHRTEVWEDTQHGDCHQRHLEVEQEDAQRRRVGSGHLGGEDEEEDKTGLDRIPILDPELDQRDGKKEAAGEVS